MKVQYEFEVPEELIDVIGSLDFVKLNRRFLHLVRAMLNEKRMLEAANAK